MAASRAPGHLSAPQKRLWLHVAGTWDLEQHQLRLLTLMCEALDRGEQAREAVKSDGAYLPDRFGQLKPHPALAVERDARIAVARLARELNLEPPASESRPPRRRT